MTIHGETLCASQEKALTVELYLQDRFEFRSNVLNGKVEFRCKGKTDEVFRPLTERVQNSIVLNLLARMFARKAILNRSSNST